MQVPFEVDREAYSSPSAPVSRDELRYRLRQQSLLGEFGRTAMQTRDFRKILQRATELCASGLQAQFAKVLEYDVHCEGIIYFDAEISDRALDLGMSEQKLDGPEIACAPVNQGCFCAAQ